MNLRTACISATILCLSAGMAPHAIHAQAAPLVVEVRAGASTPFGDFANGSGVGEGVAAGTSFGVRLAMSGSGRRTLFGGFSQHRFSCEETGCPAGSDFVATGLDAGLQINLVTRGGVVPWLRLGGLTIRVETPGLPGSPEGVSSLGWGGELGFGVYLGTTSSVALNPGIRAVAVNTELPGGSVMHMRYIVADLGLALAF